MRDIEIEHLCGARLRPELRIEFRCEVCGCVPRTMMQIVVELGDNLRRTMRHCESHYCRSRAQLDALVGEFSNFPVKHERSA